MSDATARVLCRCGKTFKSPQALTQHMLDSPRHPQQPQPIPTTKRGCKVTCTCGAVFKTDKDLQQHQRYSRLHLSLGTQLDTPLDRFFLSFPSFEYDRSIPPATSFKLLRTQKRWRMGSEDSKNAWSRYQKALEDEVRVWFGKEDDLNSWHTLCRAIGIATPPKTIKKCEMV
jgi:uncharacterized C2H2 Zn-finger protein